MVFSCYLAWLSLSLQSYPVGYVHARPRYAPAVSWDEGSLGIARHLVTTQGWRSLWRGIWPCLVPAFPANAIGFVLYEMVLSTWK